MGRRRTESSRGVAEGRELDFTRFPIGKLDWGKDTGEKGQGMV